MCSVLASLLGGDWTTLRSGVVKYQKTNICNTAENDCWLITLIERVGDTLVSMTNKKCRIRSPQQVYFSHLNDADLSQQVSGLAMFLKDEALEAIHHLESLHNSDNVQMDLHQVSSTTSQTEMPGIVVAETIESGINDKSVSDKSEPSLEMAVFRGLELKL
ncbi:hypothetical protein MIR68_001201 [Amoeboaphelidium protococcarum]|nr:hypothetical protein MIR68_001201 [Amoeboaphelidium protococcarum]